MAKLAYPIPKYPLTYMTICQASSTEQLAHQDCDTTLYDPKEELINESLIGKLTLRIKDRMSQRPLCGDDTHKHTHRLTAARNI